MFNKDRYSPYAWADQVSEGFQKGVNKGKEALGELVHSLDAFVPIDARENPKFQKFVGPESTERNSNGRILQVRREIWKNIKELIFDESNQGFLHRAKSASKIVPGILATPEAVTANLLQSTKSFTLAATDLVTFPFGPTDYKLDVDLLKYSKDVTYHDGVSRWFTTSLFQDIIGKAVLGIYTDPEDKAKDKNSGILGAVKLSWEAISEGFMSTVTLSPSRMLKVIKSTPINAGLWAINTVGATYEVAKQVSVSSVPAAYSTSKWALGGIFSGLKFVGKNLPQQESAPTQPVDPQDYIRSLEYKAPIIPSSDN